LRQISGEHPQAGGHRSPAALLSSGSAGLSTPPEQALFQPELRRSLQMHFRLALLASLVGLAVTCAYFFRLWPIYEAKSLLYVAPASGSLMNQNNTSRWPIDGGTYESYLQQKMGDVTRPDVLAAALRKMPPGLWQKGNESDQAAAERLGRAIQVDRSGSYQMSIGVRAPKPENAAALANAVTTAYLETTARDTKRGDTQRLAILKEEHDRVQTELNADRAEQSVLGRQLGMASTAPNAPDLYDAQIGRTRDELIRVRTEHDEAAARFAAMNASSGESSSAIDAQAEEVAAADPGLVSIKTALNQRKATLVSQMANLTPNHPLYKQDAAELEKINTELDSASRKLHTQAVGRIQQKLRSDMERTAQVEAQLNGQLRSAVGAAAGASVKIQRANDLSADVTRLQNRYAAVDEQLHNLMLDAGAPGAVTLIAAAVPPLHPIRSGVFRNTIVLAGASIVFGLFLAVLAHKLDPKVYIASDVENVLGFAPMAQLPRFAQVSEGVAAEHLIRLAGDIEHVALQDGIHTVVLTGAAEGAGVSALASQLRPVLSPAVTHPADGSTPAGVTLVEAPPVLLSAEAEFQVRRAGWTLAVIESGVTTRAEVRNLAAALKRLDAPAVGFILHQIDLSKADPAFRSSIREAERHVQQNGGSSVLRVREQRQQKSGMTPAPAAQDQLPAPTMPFASVAPVAAAQMPPAAVPALPTVPSAGVDSWWSHLAPVQDGSPQPVPMQSVSSPAPAYPPATSFAAMNFDPPAPHPAPAAAPLAPEPVAPPAPASRLNGLRGAAFHRGLMHLGRGSEPAVEANSPQAGWPVVPPVSDGAPASYAAPAPPPSAAYPPLNERTAAPVPNLRPVPPVSRHTEVAFAPSRGVMAQPEILPPPKEFIPIRDGDAEDDDGTAQRDRRDPYDELDILPSWRGQYRKRS